jgi:hypothetical protein
LKDFWYAFYVLLANHQLCCFQPLFSGLSRQRCRALLQSQSATGRVALMKHKKVDVLGLGLGCSDDMTIEG